MKENAVLAKDFGVFSVCGWYSGCSAVFQEECEGKPYPAPVPLLQRRRIHTSATAHRIPYSLRGRKEVCLLKQPAKAPLHLRFVLQVAPACRGASLVPGHSEFYKRCQKAEGKEIGCIQKYRIAGPPCFAIARGSGAGLLSMCAGVQGYFARMSKALICVYFSSVERTITGLLYRVV